MSINVNRQELDGLLRTFKRLPDDVQRKGMEEALLAGAKPIQAAAEQNAPIGGAGRWPRRRPNAKPLRDSIVTRASKQKRADVVRVFSTNPAASAIELGHDIVRNGKVVGHAGPHPFMRRGFDMTKNNALRLIVVNLGKTIDRLWQRG